MEDRKFAVRFSAHGSGYKPDAPVNFNLTFEEAEKEGKDWRAFADTVGGDYLIVEEEK